MRASRLLLVGSVGLFLASMTCAAQAQEAKTAGTVTGGAVSPPSPSGSGIDYEHAIPFPMPKGAGPVDLHAVNPPANFGAPGFHPGSVGNGVKSPVQLAAPKSFQQGAASPQEFGSSGQPYTTSQVNAYGNQTSQYYPFRAAGKLFFKEGTASYVCSASLIGPGLVVTAAHCVANYGKSQFYNSWQYAPAYNNGTAPYGTWSVSARWVLTKYFNGADNCAQSGVICPDDVAVLVLTPQSGVYAGTKTGWYAYGYNGYSYNSSQQALITQLGYPVALDGGSLMERNDSQGQTNSSQSSNTIIGSLMTGGSSGGPWLVNLGAPPALNGAGFGTSASHNVVVGVTSWGYTSTTVKQQGASPFTSGNIVVLHNTACAAVAAAC